MATTAYDECRLATQGQRRAGPLHVAALLAGGAALLLAAAVPASADTDQVSYNPEWCKTPAEGQVFVRLVSGMVFAFPYHDLVTLRGGPVNVPRPVPDPTEPEGCPDNPIITPGLVVAYRAVAPRDEAEPPGRRWGPQLLQIFGHDGPTAVQGSNLRSFDLFCGDDGIGTLIEHPPMLVECRARHTDSRGRGPDDAGSAIKARPGMYAEFEGRPFVVYCNQAVRAGGLRVCEARYEIETGLSVMYRFTDDVVPVPHMAAFDLQIRAFVAAHRRPDLDALPIIDWGAWEDSQGIRQW